MWEDAALDGRTTAAVKLHFGSFLLAAAATIALGCAASPAPRDPAASARRNPADLKLPSQPPIDSTETAKNPTTTDLELLAPCKRDATPAAKTTDGPPFATRVLRPYLLDPRPPPPPQEPPLDPAIFKSLERADAAKLRAVEAQLTKLETAASKVRYAVSQFHLCDDADEEAGEVGYDEPECTPAERRRRETEVATSERELKAARTSTVSTADRHASALKAALKKRPSVALAFAVARALEVAYGVQLAAKEDHSEPEVSWNVGDVWPSAVRAAHRRTTLLAHQKKTLIAEARLRLALRRMNAGCWTAALAALTSRDQFARAHRSLRDRMAYARAYAALRLGKVQIASAAIRSIKNRRKHAGLLVRLQFGQPNAAAFAAQLRLLASSGKPRAELRAAAWAARYILLHGIPSYKLTPGEPDSKFSGHVQLELAYLAAHRGDHKGAKHHLSAARRADGADEDSADKLEAALNQPLTAAPRKSARAPAKRVARPAGLLGLLTAANTGVHPWRAATLSARTRDEVTSAGLEQVISLCHEAEWWTVRLPAGATISARWAADQTRVKTKGGADVAPLSSCLHPLRVRLEVELPKQKSSAVILPAHTPRAFALSAVTPFSMSSLGNLGSSKDSSFSKGLGLSPRSSGTQFGSGKAQGGVGRGGGGTGATIGLGNYGVGSGRGRLKKPPRKTRPFKNKR